MSWVEQVIHVDMTPRDLRMIADLMEQKEKSVQIGDDTKVYEWTVDNNTRIAFHFDTERMNKNVQSNKPHYQALKFNISIPDNYSYVGNLYRQELQDGLCQYESEKAKMPITVSSICYNKQDNFINDGGSIELAVGTENDCKSIDLKFSTLKSVSTYSSYLFDEVSGDNILGVYGDLYYKLPSDIKSVRTYTIVYNLQNGIREVTLHDFGKYGKILTRCDLKRG